MGLRGHDILLLSPNLKVNARHSLTPIVCGFTQILDRRTEAYASDFFSQVGSSSHFSPPPPPPFSPPPSRYYP